MQKSVATILMAMLAIGLVGASTHIEALTVRARGIITQWGSEQVFGWVDAHAVMVDKNGTYHEWARVHAMWSYDKPRLNCTKPPTENVTFSFYVAKLVKSTEINLSRPGLNLYIAGFWNVAKITTSIYVNGEGKLINVTRVFEPILTNATGEFRTFPGPPLGYVFELDIDGIEMLSGFIRGFIIIYKELKICDLDDDGDVDLIEIVRVAKIYKAVPGMPGYNVEMDFDLNYRIDMGDLTTVAANIEP